MENLEEWLMNPSVSLDVRIDTLKKRGLKTEQFVRLAEELLGRISEQDQARYAEQIASLQRMKESRLARMVG